MLAEDELEILLGLIEVGDVAVLLVLREEDDELVLFKVCVLDLGWLYASCK